MIRAKSGANAGEVLAGFAASTPVAGVMALVVAPSLARFSTVTAKMIGQVYASSAALANSTSWTTASRFGRTAR